MEAGGGARRGVLGAAPSPVTGASPGPESRRYTLPPAWWLSHRHSFGAMVRSV